MNIVFLFVCVCVCKASFFFCFLKILRIKTLNYQFFLSIVIKSLTDFLYEFSITIFIFFFFLITCQIYQQLDLLFVNILKCTSLKRFVSQSYFIKENVMYHRIFRTKKRIEISRELK